MTSEPLDDLEQRRAESEVGGGIQNFLRRRWRVHFQNGFRAVAVEPSDSARKSASTAPPRQCA